jgi:hypothetical protein
VTATSKISRDDLEAKFRELQGDVQDTAEEATSYAVVVAAVLVVGIAAVTFVLGRRRGRKKSTIVEIRRI